MVRAARSRLPSSHSVSVKIRLHTDLSRTIAWVKTVLAGGDVTYISIHGRTRSQRSSTPPDYAAIRQLRQHISIPVLANGDAYTLSDVHDIAAKTGADGIMAARGILENPTMFVGHNTVPVEAVQKLLEYCVRHPIPFALVLHHVSEMTARMKDISKQKRRALMACRDLIELIDWIEERWGFDTRSTSEVG
jgi:tRNA-dihydrouridine synthase 4